MIRTFVALAMLALASACAQLPRAELQAYTAAFDATRAAADPLMADYAVAERSERLIDMQKAQDRGFTDFFPSFRVSDAAAVSSVSLPPGAAAVDRTFSAIARYNQTLVALAENRNVEEARGQLSQVIDDLGAIAPPVARAPVIKPAANLLIDLLKPAIAADNKEQFKEIVLAGKPHVKELIGILRDYTPTQYDFTTSALQAQANMSPPPPDRDKIVAQINNWHRAYADYVVLLNALDRRVDELADAVEHPKSQPFLQRAAAGAAELRAYADALRLSMAQLRARP